MTTVYFAGGEDTSFTFIGNAVFVNTNNSNWRNAWARECIQVSAGSTTDPPSPRFATPIFTANPRMWVHAQLSWPSGLGGGNTANATMFRLLDSGTARIVVRGTGTLGQLAVCKRNAAGSFTTLFTTASGVVPNGGLVTWSMDLNLIYNVAVIQTTNPQTDISFSYGSPATISRVTGSFIADGFVTGDIITVSGSVSNDGIYFIQGVTTTTMTLLNGEVLSNEAAGNSVTIVTSGYVGLFINGILVGQYSGDTTTDSATTLNSADFADHAASPGLTWSEIIIADTNTINKGLLTLPPLAAGAVQAWAGSFTNIDKQLIDDTSFISDGTPNDLSGWTTPISFPTGSWIVDAIVQEARAAVGITGPQHFAWYLRTADGSNHTTGSEAPSTFFANFGNQIWANNPFTSLPWQTSDITSGFNLGVQSLV